MKWLGLEKTKMYVLNKNPKLGMMIKGENSSTISIVKKRERRFFQPAFSFVNFEMIDLPGAA